MEIQLERPRLDLFASYMDFILEMKNIGEKIWEGFLPKTDESPIDFLNRILRQATTPDPGLVPETKFWATRHGQVVGRISLRHELTDKLRNFGGNIGYEVRPSVRKQGIAKEMLRQILLIPECRKLGKVLLTCAPDNLASNKTITANGGVLEKTAYVAEWQRATNYYWIELRHSYVGVRSGQTPFPK